MMLCFLLVDKRCVILDVFLCAPTQIGSLTTLTAIAIFVWELVRLRLEAEAKNKYESVRERNVRM